MKLSDHHLAFFDTFGFLAFPGLFADDIDRITGALRRSGPITAAGITGESTTASSDRRSSSSSTRTST